MLGKVMNLVKLKWVKLKMLNIFRTVVLSKNYECTKGGDCVTHKGSAIFNIYFFVIFSKN